MYENIAIIGASGAIGSALVKELEQRYPNAYIHPFSRSKPFIIDYQNEESVALAAEIASKDQSIDLVFCATGLLHDEAVMPEKSLKELDAFKLLRLYAANTIIPAIVAKHFIPKLNKDRKSVFAALSARVGSISDNRLGGWYSYRMSKAALNMLIKTAAIETARKNKHAILVGLHPGTVDSGLSKPFQNNVEPSKLFSPEFSAQQMLNVLDHLRANDSGKLFAWDGAEITP